MTDQPVEARYRKSLGGAFVVAVLFAAMLGLLLWGQGKFDGIRGSILSAIPLGFSTVMLFLIFYTGRVNRWRKLFFTAYAVAFVIEFVWWTMGDRGHMWLLDKEILNAQAPMCHMVVPMLLLPLILTGRIIFPTGFSGATFMILMVGLVGLVFGRAFCSWGCFFGGQDELFSSLQRKKVFKIGALSPRVRYFAFGLLLFIVLHSLATLSPTYCFWLCPFKATSEFIEVNSFSRIIQTFLFVALWIVLVVLLPLLTKKRIQCGLFCPMGAFLSCTNKINLFRLKIDQDRCNRCQTCVEACPTFSLTPESIAQGRALTTCTHCGACVEACPRQAIAFTVKGTQVPAKPMLPEQPRPSIWKRLGRDLWDPGVVQIMGIFMVANIIALDYFSSSLSRLLKYFLGV